MRPGMRSRRSPRFLLPAALLALAACNEHPLKEVELSRTAETVLDVDIAPLRNVDILFVIDNSGSMAAEQANLAANLAPMIERLEEEQIAADYRIAVTTTDVDDKACKSTGPEDGNFVATSCRDRLEQFITQPNFTPREDAQQSACMSLCPESLEGLRTLPSTIEGDPAEVSRPWIENILGTTNLPEGVTTEQAFACMGPQGIDGCGVEAPLRAMQRALTRAGASTEDEYGFMRDDAILLVVFVTDEADCSANGRFPSEIGADGTSTGCWNAGVQCSEGPDGSLDCTSANLDVDGNVVPADEALLRPVEEYVAFLEAVRQQKQEAVGTSEVHVMVSIVAGVPTGYPTAPVVYDRQTPYSDEYGIDAGCLSEFGDAVPPVRLLEFAEAFAPESGTNVSSVCASSYAPALENLADILEDVFEPSCVDTCLAGGRGEDCVFRNEIPGQADELVPQCEIGSDGEPALPSDAAVCVFVAVDDDRHAACREGGAPTEFKPLYRAGVRRVPGSTISATCSISDDEATDCPWAF